MNSVMRPYLKPYVPLILIKASLMQLLKPVLMRPLS
jgi:hypothetical protein